jgi:hypothetical protein
MADDDLSRLTQDEKTALTALLKRTIADDRFPLSPRSGRCGAFSRSSRHRNRRRPRFRRCSLMPRHAAPQSSGECGGD